MRDLECAANTPTPTLLSGITHCMPRQAIRGSDRHLFLQRYDMPYRNVETLPRHKISNLCFNCSVLIPKLFPARANTRPFCSRAHQLRNMDVGFMSCHRFDKSLSCDKRMRSEHRTPPSGITLEFRALGLEARSLKLVCTNGCTLDACPNQRGLQQSQRHVHRNSKIPSSIRCVSRRDVEHLL